LGDRARPQFAVGRSRASPTWSRPSTATCTITTTHLLANNRPLSESVRRTRPDSWVGLDDRRSCDKASIGDMVRICRSLRAKSYRIASAEPGASGAGARAACRPQHDVRSTVAASCRHAAAGPRSARATSDRGVDAVMLETRLRHPSSATNHGHLVTQDGEQYVPSRVPRQKLSVRRCPRAER
jgi:hypothetical protein